MRLLLVEDEEALAELIRKRLLAEGLAVDWVRSGEDGVDWSEAASYDAILLDIRLPGIDGYEVCRRIRLGGDDTPILMLTARDAIADRVEGLDAGADDYLIKPFAFAELLARVRALSRRGNLQNQVVLQAGKLQLDPAAHRVWNNQNEIELTGREFRILEYLLRNQGRVVTRDQIAENVWDFDFPSAANVIDVHIRSLRQKLDEPLPGSMIQTERGIGYRLSESK